MKHTKIFDVLVVYNNAIAKSASSNSHTLVPFHGKSLNYNNAYSFFLEECERLHLTAAFTTPDDHKANGVFNSYWMFSKNGWKKYQEECYSELIFDKFSPSTKIKKQLRKDIFSNSKVKPFNNDKLFSLFFDKHNTHSMLKKFTIPTVKVTNKKNEEIKKNLLELAVLIQKSTKGRDFSNQIVLKDRFGAGGNSIFLVKRNNAHTQISNILKKNSKTKFVIQPFTNYKNGYTHKKYSGFIDIRIIYLNGKAVQTYIRMAKPNDFRCNEHQGGTLEYISLAQIPKKVLEFSNSIAEVINMNTSLYALDFILSDMGTIFLVEGNTGPGLDWNLSLVKNELHAKKLITLITKSIFERVNESAIYIDTTSISKSYIPPLMVL